MQINQIDLQIESYLFHLKTYLFHLQLNVFNMHLEMTIQDGDIAILKPKRFASLTFLNHTKYWALISN